MQYQIQGLLYWKTHGVFVRALMIVPAEPPAVKIRKIVKVVKFGKSDTGRKSTTTDCAE